GHLFRAVRSRSPPSFLSPPLGGPRPPRPRGGGVAPPRPRPPLHPPPPPSRPTYRPRPPPPDSATTVFGYNDMRELREPLVERFAATHAGLRVGLDLPGTRFAPAVLAANRAALAPMGAELTPAQRSAYRA